VLVSLVIAAAAAFLPASFVTIRYESTASMGAQDDDAPDRDGSTSSDGESISEDDDLDERDGDLDDELLAVIELDAHAFVPLVNEASWLVHTPRSPRAPHPDDALRPPIAA
jgi:hypothetical protein